jgi:Reverse transcriptase (RNA-dependent DNA polymerase)
MGSSVKCSLSAQGSLASPILFVIYLSGVSKAIEEAVPGIKVLSFAEDLGLVAPAGSVDQVCSKLQAAGEAAIAVQFDAEKTEAVLFTRKRGRQLNEQIRRARTTVGNHEAPFRGEATRWLGIWLDTGLP